MDNPQETEICTKCKILQMVAKTDCRIIFILSISPIPLSKHQLKVNIKDIRATSTDVAKVSLRFTMNWYVATYIVQQLKISFIKQVIREITAQNSNKFTWPTFEDAVLVFLLLTLNKYSSIEIL